MGKKFCRKFFCCLLMVTMLFTFNSSSSSATEFLRNSYKIEKQIQYFIHEDYGTTTMKDMNEALYQWHAAAGWNPMYRDPNVRHDLTIFPDKDSLSCVYRNETGRTGVIASNKVFTEPPLNYTVTESDINLNMTYSWANGAQVGRYDTWSIFLHETGHTMGLADVNDNNNLVMSGKDQYNRTNTIKYRYLTTGDKKGVKAIYG